MEVAQVDLWWKHKLAVLGREVQVLDLRRNREFLDRLGMPENDLEARIALPHLQPLLVPFAVATAVTLTAVILPADALWIVALAAWVAVALSGSP